MPPDEATSCTTSKSRGESDPDQDHGGSVGYLNGDWVAADRMQLSLRDDGFRHSATAVERMRTYDGEVFQLPAHLNRLRITLDVLGIQGVPDDSTIAELVAALVRRNGPFVKPRGDVGITIVATPGTPGHRPTLAMHVNEIDHEQVLHRRNSGQPLVITDVAQPPAESWPRGIKVRCRLHYFLADQTARKSHADASGILRDADGSITETSIANLAIVKDGAIVSPPPDRVLGGITQRVVESIAAQHSIAWTKRPVTTQELLDADEVLLMGTDTGIWFANHVDEVVMVSGRVYTQLSAAFQQLARPSHQG